MTRVAARRGSPRERLFAMFDSASDGVHAVGADQRIVFWNRVAEKLTGLGPEEAVGRYCYDVIAGGDYEGHPFCRRDCPTIKATMRGRSVQNYDVCSRTACGGAIWLNVSVLSVGDPEGEGRLAVHLFRDVTRRRQAELLAQQTVEAVAKYEPEQREPDREDSGFYPAPMPRLSRREMDVLRLLASGTPVPDMVGTLGITQATVRNHIEHILAKLGVHNRLEAVVCAARLRLI